ncbi:MAG: hypothetical protein DME55_01355 [Verrucomicrobia bacterium]|nr:MAG: hypothetical protein DME55_01355 [Verrucomicrobiota bacterium]
MPDRIPFYRRPPVIERVLSVWADMSDEIFESHFEDWRAIVMPEYPVYEPLKQWLISVTATDREGEEGLPLFDPTQPELRITPRFEVVFTPKVKQTFDPITQ